MENQCVCERESPAEKQRGSRAERERNRPSEEEEKGIKGRDECIVALQLYIFCFLTVWWI